jgi:ribonuclease D
VEIDPSAIEASSLNALKNPVSAVHLIETPDQLTNAVAVLANAAGPIAIDAERASGFKYSQRAYLLQIKAKGSDIFLIDPTSDDQLVESKAFRELRVVLATHEWILHAATQDIPCREELGLRPTSNPELGLGPSSSQDWALGWQKSIRRLTGAPDHYQAAGSTMPR